MTDAPRPVPLSYDYTFETLEATVELGLRAGEAPMYIVHFSQDEALKNAGRWPATACRTRPSARRSNRP